MSLLLQLLLTLLYCTICDLSQFVSADDSDIDNINLDNIDEVCARLIIEYQDEYNNDNNIYVLEIQSYSLYNRSVWSIQHNSSLIIASYDGRTNFWEIILPSIPNSNLPNIYRLESDVIVPTTSTKWASKWTSNEKEIKFDCKEALYPTGSPTAHPIQLTYPSMFKNCNKTPIWNKLVLYSSFDELYIK